MHTIPQYMQGRDHYTIGVISDTHGLLRPEVADALQNADLIIHAGDIGTPRVLEELKSIAPVVAVRGNMDNGGWANTLRVSEIVEIESTILYVLHDIHRLDLDPVPSHVKAVISGHSHRPSIQRHKGVLYVNPGSAGPRRFTLPVSVALIHMKGCVFDAELIKLNV